VFIFVVTTKYKQPSSGSTAAKAEYANNLLATLSPLQLIFEYGKNS